MFIKKKSVSMTLRDTEIKLIEKAAKEFNYSKSDIVRKAIVYALKKKKIDFEKILEGV